MTEPLKTFGPADKPITGDGVTPDEGGWRIEGKKKLFRSKRSVRLFEIAEPGVEEAMVIYRAQLKTANLGGKAYLEMWCRFADAGEYFSKGILNPVSGTTNWASYETPFRLEKGQRPDLIKLNLVIEGGGSVWIKDVELRKEPLRP
jgi:hypothetical protein